MLLSHIKTSAWSGFVTCLAISRAAVVPSAAARGHYLQTVYQFGNYSWLENMAIRSNGHILATDLDRGLVYDLDPNTNPVSPEVVAVFPQGSTPTGATEVTPDVFYIGNTQGDAATLTFTPGTSTIWKVDMNTYTKGGKAALTQVMKIPPAQMLNGIATVSPEIILVTDSVGGTIYSVNLRTRTYALALDHRYLKANPNARPSFGVNGIRIRGSTLYFSNTNYGYLGTFPISPSGQITPSGNLITTSAPAADDFDIDSKGNIWLAENEQNTLVRITPGGKIDTVAGGTNSTELLGPVSARFGTCKDKPVLYVSTDGLSFSSAGDVLTTAGKIVKIDVEHSGYAY